MEARVIATGALRSAFLALTSLALIAAAPVGSARDERFDALVAGVKAGMLTDPVRAVGEAQRVLAYARRADSPQMEAEALWLLGEGYSRIAEPTRATQILSKARELVERAAPGSQLNADILLSEGSVLHTTGQVGRALADLRRAHDMFRDSGDTRSRAKALIMMALVHAAANDYASALRYYGEAMEAYRADPGLSVAIRNGRGMSLRELKRYKEAEQEFSAALAIAGDMKSPLLYAQVLSNLAMVRLDQHNLAGADRAIREGLARTAQPEAAASFPDFIALAAQAAFERGDGSAARRLIGQRFANVDLTTTLLPERLAHEIAYRIYTGSGESNLALQHLAALKRLDDQATATARSTSAAIASAQFDFANQELRIAQLKAADLQKSVAFERARARTQQNVLLGVAGVTLFIIALLTAGLVTIRRSRNALARSNTALGKALAAKTEFLATTSHEIRTPLNGILGMTQVMLADPRTDADTRDRLSVVHDAGVTMRALVDDILDVAKIETGKMTLEEVPTDIRRTVGEATRMWQDQAAAKGLAFSVDLTNGPYCAIADGTRLRQIVFNLLSNAVKFTPEGAVTVTSAIVGDRWQLKVSDTGIGVAPEKQEIIFEAFRQADTGTTRQFGGTGLGLSICRNLSRAMGGDVTVASVEGQGATFMLELPYEPVEPTEAGAEPGEGVLVVDRNPITRAMFKALLSPAGGPVSFAGTMAEAAEATATKKPAIVLIDDATMRTAEDHLALVRRIADDAPDAKLALLGPALSAGEERELRAAGLVQFIAKPIGKEALVEALLHDEPRVTALVSEAA